MKRFVFLIVVCVAAACGGKSSTSSGTGPEGPAAKRLPWEASLTTGATFAFELEEGFDAEDGADELVVKVTNVEDKGTERVYSLDWGDHGGPSKIVVRGELVLVGDAEAAQMEEPMEMPGGGILCYAEDFSNPDGCQDVCEASLCLAEGRGIVAVSGLYAPGYLPYTAK